MQAAAYSIGFHAEADQIVGMKVIEGLSAGERHNIILNPVNAIGHAVPSVITSGAMRHSAVSGSSMAVKDI
jgi:hypothetical protein